MKDSYHGVVGASIGVEPRRDGPNLFLMKSAHWIGAGIGVGVALGAGLGATMDNVAMGIGIGIAVGAGIGMALDLARKG